MTRLEDASTVQDPLRSGASREDGNLSSEDGRETLPTAHLRILVVGDSYMPVATFERAFAALAGDHQVSYLQLDETRALEPATPSERRIREYAGTPDQVAQRLADVDVLVVHGAPVTADVLDAAPRLRLVGCARGGPVNVDAAALAKRGIPLVNTPGKNAGAVADLTVAFLVMLARRLPKACGHLLDGNRVGETAFEGIEFFGNDLDGHVLGLVGYGHVGARVARRARPFGLQVRVHDPYVTIPAADGVDQVDDLATLLRTADFVSLHARASADGQPLVGADELALLKRGAWFVNTAREQLVDEAALDAALGSGHLGGAALDVVNPRAEGGRHPLLRHENVVLTPHIGGATAETLLHGATMLAEEVATFARGGSLAHVVPAPQGLAP